jgi:hypothetical protein
MVTVFTLTQLLPAPRISDSPELAPLDGWRFGYIKTGLDSRGFAEPAELQGVPPEHEHLNIGRIKLHSSMTFI